MAIIAQSEILHKRNKAPFRQEKVTGDTFNCKLNGTVVEIGRDQLCNNVNDCDIDDQDGHALDEKPEICQGKFAIYINIGYFSVFFAMLLASSCLLIFKKSCEQCKIYDRERGKEEEMGQSDRNIRKHCRLPIFSVTRRSRSDSRY